MSKRKTTDGLQILNGTALKLAKTSLTSTATTLRDQTLPDGDGQLLLEDAVNGLTLTKPLKLVLGTASEPGLAFQGDANTGIYSTGADTFNMTAGGVDIFRLTPTEVRIRTNLTLEGQPLRWLFSNHNYNPNASYSTGCPASELMACEFNQVNDNVTAAATTVTDRADYIFGYKDVRATNAGITYTNSATLFITGKPTHSLGTSTATNRFALMTPEPVAVGVGAATTPGYAFKTFPTTGMYAQAGPQMAWSINGVQRLLLSASSFRSVGRLEIQDGNVGAPGLSFQADTNCGMRRIGVDNISTVVGGEDIVTYTTTTVAMKKNLVCDNTTLQVGNGGSNGTGTAHKCIYSSQVLLTNVIAPGSVDTITAPNNPIPATGVRSVTATIFTGTTPGNWDRVIVSVVSLPATNPGNIVFGLYNVAGASTTANTAVLQYTVYVS